MSQFLNHVAIAAPRNGTATHTVTPSSGTVVAGSLFTPTAGRLLVVVVEGAVTSTTPAGWTLPPGGSAINNTGLYVWYRTAAGSDSLATTHNGSDYPVVFDFYEYPSTATWVGVVSATAVNPGGGAGPTLSGLSGTNQVYAVGGQAATASFVGPWAGSWSAGTETTDTSAAYATTDGYTFGVTEFVDDASSSESAAWTSTNGSGATAERLVWAVNVPVAGDPPIASVRSNRMFSEWLPRGGAALWAALPGEIYLQRLLPAATGDNTGTIAASTPLATSTITGASTNAATLATSTPLVVAAITEVVAANTGTLTTSVPRATSTLTGAQANPGTLTAPVPVLTAAMTGTSANTGTLAASTIRPTSTLAGASTDTGTLAASAPVAAASITGTSTNSATLSASAPRVTASIADTASITGTASASLPRVTASIAGTQTNAATFSATMPRATAALTGQAVNAGTMAASVVRPTAAISGTMTNGATMTTVTPVPVAALAGSSVNAAVLTVSLPLLTFVLTASYLPLVDPDHMRPVPARNGTRTVDARDPIRTVPARGSTRTVAARDGTRTITARPNVRRVP